MATTEEKRPSQAERIAEHGRKLLAIFPRATERDPVKLCKRLRALEARAAAVALRLCNGPEYPGGYEAVDKITDAILAKVDALLGNHTTHNSETGDTRCRVPIFINRDPRGYALKIEDDWVSARRDSQGFPRIDTDWGGYGIIAPEIEK